MVCDCNVWIKGGFAYHDVLNLLTWKNKDCVLVDVGCGYSPYLHEVKRHLKKHGVECRTIGIDIFEKDIEVDTFLRKNIYEIKDMNDVADVVVSLGVFTTAHSETGLKRKRFFSDKKTFKQCIDNCANMLKNDGVMVVGLLRNSPVYQFHRDNEEPLVAIKIMNKTDLFKHADECCNKYLVDCKHGLDITFDTEPNNVRDYLPWLSPFKLIKI